MHISFKGSFAKTPEYPESNEDCYIISPNSNRIVMCDGASESFDSKKWALSLAEMFINDPAINSTWVDNAVAAYNTNYDVSSLSWSKQAAFNRGSFSTLLAIEINEVHDCVEILAIGDSIVILVEDNSISESWPYTYAEQFNEHPSLLSTISDLNQFIRDDSFNIKRQISWSFKERTKPILLCMTDALGQWVLRMREDNDASWKQLLEIESNDHLANLVLAERAAKRMRTDDSTLIVLRFENEINA